jgi:hypothetical protein
MMSGRFDGRKRRPQDAGSNVFAQGGNYLLADGGIDGAGQCRAASAKHTKDAKRDEGGLVKIALHLQPLVDPYQ